MFTRFCPQCLAELKVTRGNLIFPPKNSFGAVTIKCHKCHTPYDVGLKVETKDDVVAAEQFGKLTRERCVWDMFAFRLRDDAAARLRRQQGLSYMFCGGNFAVLRLGLCLPIPQRRLPAEFYFHYYIFQTPEVVPLSPNGESIGKKINAMKKRAHKVWVAHEEQEMEFIVRAIAKYGE